MDGSKDRGKNLWNAREGAEPFGNHINPEEKTRGAQIAPDCHYRDSIKLSPGLVEQIVLKPQSVRLTFGGRIGFATQGSSAGASAIEDFGLYLL